MSAPLPTIPEEDYSDEYSDNASISTAYSAHRQKLLANMKGFTKCYWKGCDREFTTSVGRVHHIFFCKKMSDYQYSKLSQRKKYLLEKWTPVFKKIIEEKTAKRAAYNVAKKPSPEEEAIFRAARTDIKAKKAAYRIQHKTIPCPSCASWFHTPAQRATHKFRVHKDKPLPPVWGDEFDVEVLVDNMGKK